MIAHIKQMLRAGVENIISQYSPASRPDECSRFKSSSHTFRELCFVIAGTSSYMLNNNVYELNPRTAVFIDHWVPHAYGYLPKDDGLIHLWIHLYGLNPLQCSCSISRISRGCCIRPIKIIPLPLGYADILTQRLKQMELVPDKNDELINVFLSDPVNSMLNEIAFQIDHPTGSETSRDRNAAIIQAVKNHIIMCNARDCSYQTLGRLSGLSKSYLAHCFRHYTGTSIGDFVDRVRIEYTINAMKRGMKQKEIAYELGFSSPVNYWSWLRKNKDKLY